MTVAAEVYDPTGVTLQATLDESWGRQWLDELQGAGSFQVTVANTDTDLAAVDFDDVIRFDLGAGAVFGGIVEGLDPVEKAPGEEHDQFTRVTGRGLMALLARGLVYPSRGVGAKPLEQVRLMNWTSVDYDDSGWGSAVEQKIQSDSTGIYAYAPEGWPDKDAYWVWGSAFSGGHPEGDCLFRDTFTLAAAKTCRFFVTADDEFDIYVDGVRLASESRYYLWTKPTTIDVELDAGDHVLAIRGSNIPLLESVINAGAVLYNVWTTAGDGTLDALVAWSSSGTKCLAYPTVPAGMTPGLILRLFVEEAQARGEVPAGVTLGFSDSLDSDGVAWDTVADVAVKCFRNLLDVVLELAESLVDVAMTPDLVLEAWRFGTRGGASGVTPSQFLTLSHSGRGKIVNSLAVRWARDYVLVEDATSITAHGRRGDFLEVGDIQSALEAERVGTEALALRKDRRWSTTCSLPTDPGVGLGDTATLPDPEGGTSTPRARSIQVIEDDDGVLTFTYEFRDVVEDLEVRFDRWLRRMSPGALSGGSASASPAPPGLMLNVRGGLKEVAEFSSDAAITVSVSLPRPAPFPGNLTEFTVVLDTAASSGDTSFQVLLNGSAVSGSTVTIASGDTTGRVQLDAQNFAKGDVFKIEVTEVGTGASGITAQIGAI